jgi:DNA polymerase III gamma/tau subunit
MRKQAWLGMLILGMCCAACLETGPPEAELVLQTQVAQQATQLAETQRQEGPPGGATEEPTWTERPTMTPAAAEAPRATAEIGEGEGGRGCAVRTGG